MRVPRLRFTVQRMMIAVAVVAILFGMAAGLWRRHVSFKRLADKYAKKVDDEAWKSSIIEHLRFRSEPERRAEDEYLRLAEYYDELKMKYERAAARPWLPVESDRPPPDWPKGVERVDEIMRRWRMR